VYDVRVLVHLADRVESWALKYVVDTTAPVVKLEVRGVARPGRTVELVARQVITDAEVRTQKGVVRSRAQVRPDIKSIHALGPDGQLVTFNEDIVGRWHATYRIPATAAGPLALKVRVVDIADNARELAARIEVRATRLGSR
jgi:hypothetical protein